MTLDSIFHIASMTMKRGSPAENWRAPSHAIGHSADEASDGGNLSAGQRCSLGRTAD
jgi:hypothetical protein